MYKRKNKKTDDESTMANEPVMEYKKIHLPDEDEVDIPSDLLLQAFNKTQESVAKGNVYTTQQIMDKIDKEFGWK